MYNHLEGKKRRATRNRDRPHNQEIVLQDVRKESIQVEQPLYIWANKVIRVVF